MIDGKVFSKLFARFKKLLVIKGYDLDTGIRSYYDEQGKTNIHKQLFGGFKSVSNMILNIMKHTILKKFPDPLAEVKKVAINGSPMGPLILNAVGK